jgi:hypothetical protein
MQLCELFNSGGCILLLLLKLSRILLRLLINGSPVILDVSLLQPFLHLLFGLLEFLIQFEEDLVNLFLALFHKVKSALWKGLCGRVNLECIFDQFFAICNLF